MKKSVVVALVAASALLMATSHKAQAQVSVPWANSFEANTEDIPITNDVNFGAWGSTDDMIATVTNIGSYAANIQAPVVTYPLNTETHNKVLSFNGAGLTNDVAGVALENVWVDMMLQPVQMEQPAVSAAISNSQMSMFVNTNGFVCVYHAILTNETSSGFNPDAYGWTELTDFGPIGTDKWIRVTVQTDYTRLDTGRAFFQLTVNNHVYSNALAFINPDLWAFQDIYTNANLNGSWFMCANAADKINAVVFSGTGMLDDLVITNGPVSISEIVPEEEPVASPYNTPQWWLAQYTNAYPTLSVTNDDYDFDLDGAIQYEEYVAGTDPTDSNSVLRILSGQVVGGVGTVVWPGTTNMPDTNAIYYVVQAASNLVEGTWITIPGSKAGRIEGLMSNSAAVVVSPGFIRVSFTNQ